MGKLTNTAVKAAAPGKYEDGQGLRMVVTKTGSRKWVLRYQLQGRRREMGLGSYPAVSLKLARDKAAQARSQAAAGIDPISARAQVQTATPTFTQVAARFIRAKRHEWSNRKHARQWTANLKTYARPVIGSKPVDSLTTEDVLAILKPIWTTKPETAKRV